MITTVIIETHEKDRDRVASLLSSESEIKILARGKDGYDALKLNGCLKPDIVIMDNHLDYIEGGEIPPLLKMRSPATMVVILAAAINDYELFRAVSNRVSGFVHKENDLGILPQALKYIFKGGCFISPAMAARILSLINEKNFCPKANQNAAKKNFHVARISYPDDPAGYLSKTELLILACLSEGFSSEEIAAKLSLATGTVRNNISFLMSKLNLKNRIQLVHFAYYHGLAIP